MADRVAVLSGDGRRKRRSPCSPMSPTAASAQQRADAKAASSAGKHARTDTETLDEQSTTCTQDSVCTAMGSCHAAVGAAAPSAATSAQLQAQQQPAQAQAAQQAAPARHAAGGEAEGPVNDKYIKGTRLVIGGWFQACRGCNEPTAHAAVIGKREVPLCPRCQGKYDAMVGGCRPPSSAGAADAGAAPDDAHEPLHFWLPRLLPPLPRLSAAQRRDFCDMLVLRQDDAWLQLINMS
ncbi:hypothetical protein HT031_002823 [Scenedesmus sp. PABB004]|nr:hypothetical protein HT031_002823 [Scenedesmus sp. PABB004]